MDIKVKFKLRNSILKYEISVNYTEIFLLFRLIQLSDVFIFMIVCRNRGIGLKGPVGDWVKGNIPHEKLKRIRYSTQTFIVVIIRYHDDAYDEFGSLSENYSSNIISIFEYVCTFTFAFIDICVC